MFIISSILNYYFILPNILKFFLFFEQNSLYFPVHFEARLGDYLIPILLLMLNITLCFQIPSILLLLIFLNILDFKLLYIKRKYFYLSFILLSALISPPDFYNQLLLTSIIIFVYEFFIFLYFFFRYLFSNS